MKNLLLFGILLSANCAVSQTTETQKDSINQRFKLGEVVIIKPNDKNTVNATQIETFAKTDIGDALNLIPGVILSGVGPRNESTVQVRGFDLRQVPVLIDGIPVYVPYDGYVDLARFTTFDLSAIQVSKGYTSVNYGPNALGGAINLITRKPSKAFELNGATGFVTGGFRSNLNIGSKWKKFYVQAGISKLKRDYFPLSSDFIPVPNENGRQRDNSYSEDEKYHIKVAFTPNEKSEYALAYTYQKGEKGNPVYAGTDPLNTLLARPRFWRWPKWDKQSLYFISNTSIDSTQSIKTRFYYDAFKNQLDSWDDATYSAMTRPYAFRSIYDDYSFGGIVQYDKSIGKRDKISASVHYKQDVHRENNVGEPQRTMSDGTFTVALENEFLITQKLQLLTGASFNNRSSIDAEDFNGDTNLITNYPSNSNNAFNVQGGLVYKANPNNTVTLSIGRKTRFATTKDRYSYRLGTAIPNPDLEAEYAINYDLAYVGKITEKLQISGAAFYSKIHNTIMMVNNVQFDQEQKIFLSQLQNTGTSEYMGFEISADYKIFPSFLLGANYTFIERNNLSNPNLKLVDVPKNKFFVYTQYDWKDRLRAQANMEHNSRRYSTSYGTTTRSFQIFNVSASVKVYKWFSIEGGVNNIFDKNYELVEGYFEAGRNYFASVVYRY
ncbi:MAG: TonB-dependent receptor [Flavobacterium sp.]|uniref:TonB-dependent receptor plug domain-containing protein n=1 Tax=Flavobacterium sp. TaxID=239 RepID=UPI00121F649C|nr:TonB-dependent receptor [Flavobacterium sp.]RZJ64262.1 MAG: TonB-dependent receptor [Flavobacterium sp.]